MNTNRKTAISKATITPAKLIRWSGLAAMGTGLLYIAIQAIHPIDVLSSVTTTRWAIVHYMGIVMCMLGLLGLAGIYARQVEKAGWLGLAGYLLFSLFYALSMAFQFIEAFLSPVLAIEAPRFVEGFLGIITKAPSEINLGALPVVYMLAGFVGYVLGGLLFGIATFRAGSLPRWAGVVLAIGTLLPVLASSLVPHPYDRLFAVPVGLSLVWLGYALWTERRAPVVEASLEVGRAELNRSAAD